MVLGDYVYQWDRFTQIILKNKKGDSGKSVVGVTYDPSKIDEMIMKYYRGT